MYAIKKLNSYAFLNIYHRTMPTLHLNATNISWKTRMNSTNVVCSWVMSHSSDVWNVFASSRFYFSTFFFPFSVVSSFPIQQYSRFPSAILWNLIYIITELSSGVKRCMIKIVRDRTYKNTNCSRADVGVFGQNGTHFTLHIQRSSWLKNCKKENEKKNTTKNLESNENDIWTANHFSVMEWRVIEAEIERQRAGKEK